MSTDERPDSGDHREPAREVTDAMRLQILSTKHWSLLASRSLAWTESFSRAGMFLATLSGATVALGRHDDLKGITATQGYHPGTRFQVRLLSATPSVVATLTSVVAGVVGAIVGHLAADVPGAVLGGLGGFGITFVALGLYARRTAQRILGAHRPLFPGRAPPG